MANNYPTLEELLQMKAQIENSQRDAAIQNQAMNTVANMTQNLSPMGNLGIALGTIGGNLAARYFNDQYSKELLNHKNYQDFINAVNKMSLRGTINPFSPSDQSAAVLKTPPNPNLLATENSVTTTLTNTAPSTSLLMNDVSSYDWRNQRYLSNNQPYFRPTYPNGMPKNYLTTYSAYH